MSKVTDLASKREEILAQIRKIEESCEGIENENNAKRIQELNLKNAKLVAEKKELADKLSALENEILAANSEIGRLSGKGVDRILEAIKGQRWYYFKNKPKIMFDRNTGLIWNNPEYIPFIKPDDSYFLIGEAVKMAEELNVNGYSSWNIVNKIEFEKIVTNKVDYPYQYDGYYISKELTKPSGGTINGLIMKWDNTKEEVTARFLDRHRYGNIHTSGAFVVFSRECVLGTDYENNVSVNNPIYTEKERLQFTLDLFIQNEMWPIFDDEAITDLYKKIYFEKPKLLKSLREIEEQIRELQSITLLSSEFDYRNMLSKYDLHKINESVIQYCKGIHCWVDELTEKINYYEAEKKETILECERMTLPLRQRNDYAESIDGEERYMLCHRQELFADVFSAEFSEVSARIYGIKRQASDLMSRVCRANSSDNALSDLAVIEKEDRVSFEFLAESTANEVKEVLLRIERYEKIPDYVKQCVEIWQTWTNEYCAFKVSKKAAFEKKCKSKGVKAEVVKELFFEWNQIRYMIETMLFPIINYSVREGALDNQSQIEVILSIISRLESYKEDIDAFYEKKRISIYEEEDKRASSVVAEKLRCCQDLYDLTVVMLTDVMDIIEQCSELEDRVYISNWIMGIQKVFIEEIVQVLAFYKLLEECKVPLERIMEIMGISISPSQFGESKDKIKNSGNYLKEFLSEIIALFESTAYERIIRDDYVAREGNRIMS